MSICTEKLFPGVVQAICLLYALNMDSQSNTLKLLVTILQCLIWVIPVVRGLVETEKRLHHVLGSAGSAGSSVRIRTIPFPGFDCSPGAGGGKPDEGAARTDLFVLLGDFMQLNMT